MKRIVYLLLGMALVWATFSQASPVGEVVFAVGEVRLQATQQTISKGFLVEPGQTIVTGPSGHAHIRFKDDAFVSVRPQSSLWVESYVVNLNDPQKNRIKFVLQQGTVRWMTGKAGQMSKEWFRVNTPVGSIGIRGTDFVAHTDQQITRVAVYQGGVVLAPFDEACKAAAFGPCQSAQARDLSGSLSNQYLEMKAGMPVILVMPKSGSSGKLFEPPSPQEPGVSRSGASYDAPGVGQGGLQSKDQLYVSGPVAWGRWQSTQGPLGYELLGSLDNYALYRQVGQADLPKEGMLPMRLVSAEVYARDGAGGLKSATVSEPSLAINFSKMIYTTDFLWTYQGTTVSLKNKGEISPSGRFINNPLLSNFVISGGVTGNGDEAAYLFIKRLAGDDAFGVMRWRR